MTNRFKTGARPFVIAYAALFLALAAVFLYGVSLDPGGMQRILFAEGGVVETISAAGYFVCLAYVLLRGGSAYARRRHYLLALVLMFGLRELDFDKRFTTMGILKSRFFASDQVPAIEKICGAIVIAVLVYAVARAVFGHFRDYIRQFRTRPAVAAGITSAVAFMLIAKHIDGLERKLRRFGIELTEEVSRNTTTLEETLEMGIPVSLLIAWAAYFRDVRPETCAGKTAIR